VGLDGLELGLRCGELELFFQSFRFLLGNLERIFEALEVRLGLLRLLRQLRQPVAQNVLAFAGLLRRRVELQVEPGFETFEPGLEVALRGRLSQLGVELLYFLVRGLDLLPDVLDGSVVFSFLPGIDLRKLFRNVDIDASLEAADFGLEGLQLLRDLLLKLRFHSAEVLLGLVEAPLDRLNVFLLLLELLVDQGHLGLELHGEGLQAGALHGLVQRADLALERCDLEKG